MEILNGNGGDLQGDPRWTGLDSDVKRSIADNFEGTGLVLKLKPRDLWGRVASYLDEQQGEDFVDLLALIQIRIRIHGRGQKETELVEIILESSQ